MRRLLQLATLSLVAQIKKGDVLLRSEKVTPEQRLFALRHGLIGEDALPPEERSGE